MTTPTINAPARLRDDHGSSPIELAIVAPAVLLLMFAAIQVCLVFYANNLAQAAAQQGVDAARAYQADADTGSQRANTFLDRAAGDFLRARTIKVSDDGTRVSVTVTATPLSILPGGWFTITQTASGPREIITIGATS